MGGVLALSYRIAFEWGCRCIQKKDIPPIFTKSDVEFAVGDFSLWLKEIMKTFEDKTDDISLGRLLTAKKYLSNVAL
jgi:hypothetical protein